MMRRHLLAVILATFTALAVCRCTGFLRDDNGQQTTLGSVIDAAVEGAAAGAGAGGPVGAGVGGLVGLVLGLLFAAKKDRELQALKKETGRTGANRSSKPRRDVAPELSADSAPQDVVVSDR